MKTEGYKYLVKLTTPDNEHTIIMAKTNDVDECNKIARETRIWLKDLGKSEPKLNKEFCKSVVSVATAPEGACYC